MQTVFWSEGLGVDGKIILNGS